MNVLETHKQVVTDYSSYIRSFLNILDPAILKRVEERLDEGRLWPEPLLQFNPAFELAGSVIQATTRARSGRRSARCSTDCHASLMA